MARRKSYIPRKDNDFFNFQAKLVNTVVARKTAWGIPDAAVTILTDQRAIYEPLYFKAQEKKDRTAGDVDRHRQARKVYEQKIEAFVNSHIRYNDAVTRDERIEIGVPPRDTEPSPHPVITDIPYVALRGIGGGEIEMRCRTTKDKTMASMHPAANLIDYRYALLEIGDIPPGNPEDYPKRDVSSRAKFIIRVGAQNEGKRFWAVVRWVNTAKPKQEGPWTDAINITIA